MKARWILVLLALLVLVTPALCHTYVQVGVNSNFLIDDGKVYFAQSDGTLTALNLDTGEVLARKSNIKYGGTLRLVDKGILMRTYKQLAVLDQSTLEVIWQAKDEYDSTIEDDRVVSYDGNGLVDCRDLETGKILWSYNLLGALDIVVQKAKVLLFRSAVYEGPKGTPAVVLLDLESGQELMHKTTPPNVHYLEAYFDGERIYLPTGSYKGQHTPNITRYNAGRPSAHFERLVVWDLAGAEVESIPVPAGFETHKPRRDKAFVLGDKVFARGRVWKSLEDVPPQREGCGRPISRRPPEDSRKEVTATRFDLADGTVTITTTTDYGPRFDLEAERNTGVELKSSTGNWRASLPYLKNPGQVVVVAATDKKILLGTNLGHVEAINRQDGQSQWMYVFPTMRRTMSYSTYGMPPMMAKAAATYRRDNEDNKPECGLMLEDADEPSQPKVVFDPEPANPYSRLPLYLTIAWTGVLLPVLLTVLVIVLCRKRQLDVRIPAASGLVLAIGAVCCFFFYGRVSIATAIGFRFGMAIPLAVASQYAVRSLRQKREISGALVLLAALALGIFILPTFLRL
ncbi:MAG: PQQ-binding-like beta-propeller repeat protein [Phycisphaerales bacterium]|nr:MAG: PQQ-binding-like beta-propeller repeat protein [Phycisphaerales bacterium]